MISRALSQQTLDKEELRTDKKACRRFGPCGAGKKALYLNSFYIDRMYYIPYGAITRVFKRVAMSKGGFSGKGMFATMPYLVVVYDGGQEKQCLFKREEQVDEMVAYIGQKHPGIRLVSAQTEQKLAKRAAEEAAKPKPVITPEAEREAKALAQAKTFLEKRPALYNALSRSAKAKRVNERSNPAYRWVALTIVLLGAVAAAYGIWAIITKADFGVYFTLLGLAAVFLFAGANVLPTKRNNRAYIAKQWDDACEAMERYIKGFPDFPLPARYAHPVTLERMIRVIRSARAETAAEALEVVKADLKALNADVQVEQEEYDEVVAVKPMFLVENYR